MASSVPMKAILSHEDLLGNDDIDVFNTMTLKEKLYPNPVKFTEFTMCMRIKLLSFKGFLSFMNIYKAVAMKGLTLSLLHLHFVFQI